MFLLATGCSMTFGSEMFGENDLDVVADPGLNAQRLEAAWPGVLAKRMGFDGHHNAGVGGASNERIHRNTIGWIMEHWDRPFDELYVHVQWSQIHRWEFYHGGKFDTVFVNQTPGIMGPNARPKYFTRFWTRFQDSCANEWMSWRKHIQLVNLTETFLKTRNIKYSMSWGVVSPQATVWDYVEANGLVEEYINTTRTVDQTRYLGLTDPNSGMCSYLHKNGVTGDRLAPRGHPYGDGHRIWAEHLHHWIQQDNLL